MSLDSKHTEARFLPKFNATEILLTSQLGASRDGNFCANNDNDDTTDYFTPCTRAHACVQGKAIPI